VANFSKFCGPVCRIPQQLVFWINYSKYEDVCEQSMIIPHQWNILRCSWSFVDCWSSQSVEEDWQFCQKALQTWIWIGK